MARVYVGTYAKYASGSIAGAWIELDGMDEEEFLEACAALHSDEVDPEYMLQDHESIPAALFSESGLDSDFWDYVSFDDNNDGEAKAAYVNNHHAWNESDFEKTFQGAFETKLDFVYEIVESSGMLDDVPEVLKRYFDYEAYGRDLFCDGYSLVDGFVFSD